MHSCVDLIPLIAKSNRHILPSSLTFQLIESAKSTLTIEEILNYAADHLGEGNVNKLLKEARDVQPAKAHFSWRWLEAWTQS
jgi:hypothetical protein